MPNKKAYPNPNEHAFTSGMDLRDWFAGMALNGLLSNHPALESIVKMSKPGESEVGMSKASYAMADKMMEARKNVHSDEL